MQYMILIYGIEKNWMNLTPEQGEAMYAEYRAYSEQLAKAGVIRGGSELLPTATAKTIREGRGGGTVTTDGPFAETREQLGGYYLIETDAMEQALEWAAKCPGVKGGCVEVRGTAQGAPAAPSA
jgi:hypothetical protein